MTLDDLTVNFQHLSREEILSDWDWLIGKTKLPVLLLASGDAFVQEKNDGALHFLDVTAGSLTKVSDTAEEFQTLLSNKEFVLKYFAVQMVGDLINAGRMLEKGKIYSFKVSPALGGKYELNNVEIADIEVHFSINGQLHRQLKDLPVGSNIKNIQLQD